MQLQACLRALGKVSRAPRRPQPLALMESSWLSVAVGGEFGAAAAWRWEGVGRNKNLGWLLS